MVVNLNVNNIHVVDHLTNNVLPHNFSSFTMSHINLVLNQIFENNVYFIVGNEGYRAGHMKYSILNCTIQ